MFEKKMKQTLKIIFVLITFEYSTANLFGNSPSDFLFSDIDARTHALGGSIAGDLKSQSCFTKNPASLVYSTGTSLLTTIATRPESTKLFKLSFIKKIHNHYLGFNLFHTILPEQNYLDDDGNSFGTFRNSDLATNFSWGDQIGPLKYGLGTTVIRKKVAESSVSGVSLTGSMIFELHKRANLGVSINDLTLPTLKSADSSEKCPSQIRGGISGIILDRDSIVLSLLTDLFSSNDGSDVHLALGTELNLNQTLFLRGGLSSDAAGGRVGLGLVFERLTLDWSMQFSPLGPKEFMCFSFGVKFK